MSAPCTVITGANRGLGLHLARLFLAAGHDLVLVGRTPPDLGTGTGGEGGPRQLLCDLREPRALAAGLARSLDGRPVGLLVNNAGVFLQCEEHGIGGMTTEDLVDLMMVNAVAPAVLAHAALERAAPGILLVNILSDMAFPGDWDGTYPAYRSSKAMLWSLTVNLDADAARHGGKAVGVDPGWMWTDMGGPEAPDDPAAMARGIASLCERRDELDGGAVYRAADGVVVPGADGGA